MEQETKETKQPIENKPEKKKITWKDWLVFIAGVALIVSIKPIIRAVLSGGSSSSSSNIEIDFDLPDREPIDYDAIFEEAFNETE